MRFISGRALELRKKGISPSDAMKKASREYDKQNKSGQTGKSAQVSSPAPVSDDIKIVNDVPIASHIEQPMVEPNVVAVKSIFPMLYPVAEGESNALKEQIKFCIQNKISFEMKHVNGIKTVFGTPWNVQVWHAFCYEFVQRAKEIAQVFNIPNNFVLDVVTDDIKIRYNGEAMIQA